MKHVCTFAFLISFALLCGCATPSYKIKTDATNYREKLTIKKKDCNFYSADYVGSGINCFPPIENRICPNYTQNEVYKPSKELKMELFSIRIEDTSGMTSKVVKDMAYLTAAELAEQRGFKTLTTLDTVEISGCSSMQSIDTYGTFSGNTYSGTSYMNDKAICSTLYTLKVLLYDEPSDLEKGILSRDNWPPNQSLQPFKNLYIGTTPGLEEEFFEQSQQAFKSFNAKQNVNRNAWKTRYDIKGLAEELRKQYELTEKLTYTFEDEREAHKKKKEQKNADPLEKYKITK